MFPAYLAGFFTSLSLILAIGAQNAFVLRQGLRKEFVVPVVFVCATSDALLIALGVGSFQKLTPALPMLTEIMRWAGVAFLTIYGALRFRAAWRGGAALLPTEAPPSSLTRIIATCLVITWANPHVYLDTVMLIGSVSAHYDPHQLQFGIGAALGSFAFFTTLGFGARLLAPVLASIRAWIILEILIGLTMLAIAIGLIIKSP